MPSRAVDERQNLRAAAQQQASAAGNDEVMRAFIVNGTDRMPAFKYYLKPAEIDAIIAYARTVPAPTVRAANEPQK
jgi:mono/diheme cytochrome c family protein